MGTENISEEELIRKINESPHDGSKVEKIDLSGVILEEEFEKNETDEDFEAGVEDLFENYGGVLRALVDR